MWLTPSDNFDLSRRVLSPIRSFDKHPFVIQNIDEIRESSRNKLGEYCKREERKPAVRNSSSAKLGVRCESYHRKPTWLSKC